MIKEMRKNTATVTKKGRLDKISQVTQRPWLAKAIC